MVRRRGSLGGAGDVIRADDEGCLTSGAAADGKEDYLSREDPQPASPGPIRAAEVECYTQQGEGWRVEEA